MMSSKQSMGRRRLNGFVQGLLIVACLAGPETMPAQKDISKLYQETCDRLICQCGCNEQLSVCAMQNCSSATPMRAEIRERLQKGDGPDQIVRSFVDRYGKVVLSAPTTTGFDLSAWVMPFVILSLGLIVVVWTVFSMVRPACAGPGEAAPAVDPRVDAELSEFEKENRW